MKRNILSILMLVSGLTLFSQVWFNDGMAWIVRYRNTATPSNETVCYSKCYIEGATSLSDGVLAQNVYRVNDGKAELYAYLDARELKVRFSMPGENPPQWRTMYDFSLKAGESFECWIPERRNPVDIRIHSTIDDFNGTGLSAVRVYVPLSECDEAYNSVRPDNYWIKGIGSLNGLFGALDFCLDGVASVLMCVELNGQTIYQNEEYESGLATLNYCNERDVYNLNGQRVSHNGKGLYIVNGKKVAIK